MQLHGDDIMGIEGIEMPVTSWQWRKHTSRASGKDMIAVTYYGGLSDPGITEYFPIMHDGFAGDKAARQVWEIAKQSGIGNAGLFVEGVLECAEVANYMQDGEPPSVIEYKRDGKFFRVLRRAWSA
jgi:DNA repair protein RadD